MATFAVAVAGAPGSFAPMPQYVALLRGIGPANPATRNDRLAAALAATGCTEVRPVLASGNLVFQARARAPEALELKIEAALARHTGVAIETHIRSEDELAAMVQSDPFNGAAHGAEWYLTVTFFKDRRPPVFSKLARASLDGPEFMTGLDQRFGRHITTRTWNTVLKIMEKMRRSGGGPT